MTRDAAVWMLAGALSFGVVGCGSDEPAPEPDADGADDAALDVGARDDAPQGDVGQRVDAGPPAPGVLRVRRVPFNASGAALGRVQAVADTGDLVTLWGDRGMTVLRGGAVTATDASATAWRAAAVVPAGDAAGGSWHVGIDGMGRVWRLRDGRMLEQVTSRYSLDMRDARTVAPLDATRTAFGVAMGFGIADGMRVLYWDDPAFAAMTAGGGRIAAVTAEGVRVFDPTARRFLQYPLPGVTGAALDAMGRLHVAAGAVYYAEDAMGQLVARVTARVPMRSLTFSGSRLWLVAGGALGAVEGDALAVAEEVRVPAEASLRPSASGDVWVLGPATLERYGPDDSPDRRLWEETVRPVFARRCTPCHQPGGTANVDLSTYAAWVMRRASIRTQVLDLGAMPPNPPAPCGRRSCCPCPLARLRGRCGRRRVGADGCSGRGRSDAGVPMDVRDAGPRDTGADVRDAGVPMDVRDAGPRDVGADVRDVGVDVRTDAGAATMTAVQAIFTRACVSCHGSSGGLNLSTAAMSRTNLVNRPAAGGACASSGVMRVVPGNPTASLLYQKVAGTQTCGSAMPRNAARLSDGRSKHHPKLDRRGRAAVGLAGSLRGVGVDAEGAQSGGELLGACACGVAVCGLVGACGVGLGACGVGLGASSPRALRAGGEQCAVERGPAQPGGLKVFVDTRPGHELESKAEKARGGRGAIHVAGEHEGVQGRLAQKGPGIPHDIEGHVQHGVAVLLGAELAALLVGHHLDHHVGRLAKLPHKVRAVLLLEDVRVQGDVGAQQHVGHDGWQPRAVKYLHVGEGDEAARRAVFVRRRAGPIPKQGLGEEPLLHRGVDVCVGHDGRDVGLVEVFARQLGSHHHTAIVRGCAGTVKPPPALRTRGTTSRSFATPICVALRRRDRSESTEDAVAITSCSARISAPQCDHLVVRRVQSDVIEGVKVPCG